MKLRAAASPVEALQLIDENGTFDFAHGDGEREGVRLALAGERTDDGQAAGAVVADVGEDERGAALRLFAADLGIEIEEDDVAGVGHVGSYHSTDSLPTAGPVEISS